MKWSEDEILALLDACCDEYTFPMLDNGYLYLAATRLAAYRSVDDWALTIEVFGFSPRAGTPDTFVHTFGSRLVESSNSRRHAVFPLDGDWQDPEDSEIVRADAKHILLRDSEVPVPTRAEYAEYGIDCESSDEIRVFECCRALAAMHREQVLATPGERRRMVPAGLQQILQLEEWHHPDVVDDEQRPSGNEAFQQLARLLVSGESSCYQPTKTPNTHWMHWPEGGTL
ncbi:MAG: hypothetical protein AAF581_04395 [Planctomycetota bacterium]